MPNLPKAVTVRVVAAVVAVLLAVGAGSFAWWWTHPTLFGTGGGGIQSLNQPLAVADAHVTVGILFPPPRGSGAVVQLRGAKANFAANSAPVAVTFAVCVGEGIGLATDPSRFCQTLRPLPSAFRYVPDSHEFLVMTVQAKAAGQIRVDSVTVNYSQGSDELWQRGSQTFPMTVMFTAR